ncbi:MAG TPA: hypothetical protein VF609_11665, partial [Flavisolibacter sp.]
MIKQLLLIITISVLSPNAFSQKKPADLIVHNGIIYTVDAKFSIASAMAIKDGKILETGDS